MRVIARLKAIGARRVELSRLIRASGLNRKDSRDLRLMLWVIGAVCRLLERKIVAVERLRRLFAKQKESSSAILRKVERQAEEKEQKAVAEAAAPDVGTNNVLPIKPRRQRRTKKGHGRLGAKAYPGAEQIIVAHPEIKAGDGCPRCGKGRLYWHPAGRFLKLIGQAAVKAVVYLQQKFRCNSCGAIFSASLPAGIGDEGVATNSARAMVAVLRYGYGFPHWRLAKMQRALKTPLPPSTQWDMIRELCGDGVRAVFLALRTLAAQGEVIHNDDTTAKVLELAKQIGEEASAAKAAGKKRSENPNGLHNKVFTSGILSRVGSRKILLLFTGRLHAGDNLDALLAEREASRPPPIQMSDMQSCNPPKTAKTVLGACLGHGRREFVDCFKAFESHCTHVILELREVFKYDAIAKASRMTSRERLLYHQAQSGPVMDRLKAWFEQQFAERLVEPNSPLGGAIEYMLRHWEKLTLFLRIPGAPITNDDLEREFKPVQSHIKNSLFYLTANGAAIGDIIMSLIQTSVLNDENPFEYLVALQEHEREVVASPEHWLPWNWRQTAGQKPMVLASTPSRR